MCARPAVLVVLCGEADTPALAVCACLGACVTGPTLCARVCWVVCQICPKPPEPQALGIRTGH